MRGIAQTTKGRFDAKLIGYDTDTVDAITQSRPVYGTYCCASNVEIPPWRLGGLIGYDTDIDPDTFEPTSKPVYASTQANCIYPLAQLKRFTTRLLGYDTDTLDAALHSRPVYGAGANSCVVICGNTNCVLPLTLTATITSVQTATAAGSGGCSTPPNLFPCKCAGDVGGAPAVITLTFNVTDQLWEGNLTNACGACAAALPCGSPGASTHCLKFGTGALCEGCFICFGFGTIPPAADCSCPDPCIILPSVCSCDPIHFHYDIPIGCGSGPCGSCSWTIDITP